MAENESLDLDNRQSGRWRTFYTKIVRGTDAADAARRLVRNLTKTVARLAKEDHFRLADLIATSVSDPSALAEVIRACAVSHDYAQAFRYCGGDDVDRVGVVTKFLNYVRDRFFDQYELRLFNSHEHSHFSTLYDFHSFRSNVFDAAQPEIQKLAARIAADPQRPPRMPKRTAEERTAEQNEVMDMSLLEFVGTEK